MDVSRLGEVEVICPSGRFDAHRSILGLATDFSSPLSSPGLTGRSSIPKVSVLEPRGGTPDSIPGLPLEGPGKSIHSVREQVGGGLREDGPGRPQEAAAGGPHSAEVPLGIDWRMECKAGDSAGNAHQQQFANPNENRLGVLSEAPFWGDWFTGTIKDAEKA
jgi:hypothetical protein